jgi:glycosyltransferase involved in cell wall biosynthesis
MNSQSMPLVSVVTPAYNEEKYIAECIESVRAQTYPNWECTIVNNRSADKTFAIAQQYATQDSRIRVITNETFVPALANINIAYRQTSPDSKYCKMVLADDWIFPECIERMVTVMEDHPDVGIVGAYALEGSKVLWTGLPYPSTVVSGRQMCRERFFGGPYLFGSPTSVLFRSELVRNNDPFYNESNDQADSEACFKLLAGCDFGFVHQVLTYSRERSQSRLDASRALNTMASGMLHELVVYGQHYLTREEHAYLVRAAVDRYYEFLARSLLKRRNGGFWEYHEKKLQEEGAEFSRVKIAYTAAKLAVEFFPKRIRNLRKYESWGL